MIENTRKERIAIIGLGRFFSMEHRIRNELEVFSSKYLIDGYGMEGICGFENFYRLDRAKPFIRRTVILLGILLPRLRIWFETYFHRREAEKLRRKGYQFLIPHNIEDALIALKSGIPFIFHSHEYLPRQFDGSWVFRLTEIRYRDQALRRILSKAIVTCVEGDSVARQYADTYKISLSRFVVMASMPRYWEHFHSQSSSISVIKLIHHGLLVPERKIELLIDLAIVLGAQYHLTLMGPGPKDYIQALKERAKSAGNNIEVIDPVPYEQIVEKLHQYDLGLIVFGSPHFHHKYMTVPNKFWECLQARIPVLVSPESAMAEYVRSSGCGIVGHSATLNGFVSAIQAISCHDIERLKNNCEAKAWIHSRDSWLQEYGQQIDEAVYIASAKVENAAS
jgi:glycosyltransferase involved in cell wall biosynthesis